MFERVNATTSREIRKSKRRATRVDAPAGIAIEGVC